MSSEVTRNRAARAADIARMWTTWEVEGLCCWVELDAEATPPGLALEVCVVEGWAFWLLEDGRLLAVVRAGDG